MVFLENDCALRSNDSFRKQLQEEHHLGVSPFTHIDSIDMIKNFPLDYMHLICLGVIRTLVCFWMHPKRKPRLDARTLNKLSDLLNEIGKSIPKEFNRRPQKLSDAGKWKATVSRTFLLYIGLIILQNILPDDYLKHFNKLSCAIRILCSPIDYDKNNAYAEKLLIEFVEEFKFLYGGEYLTYNFHNLIHLAKDCKEHGPLDDFSAFCFENNLFTIKLLLRKRTKILQQLHRRLIERKKYFKKEAEQNIQYPNPEFPIFNHFLPEGFVYRFQRLKFENFELHDSAPNNCFLTKEGKIVLIKYICYQGPNICIIGRIITEKEAIKNYPIESTLMNIFKVRNISKELYKFYVNDVKRKACKFDINNESYIVPQLHH